MMRVLYISYDGMMEPLGQSQVLGYLRRLAPGNTVHLISFEKANDWRNTSERLNVAQDITAAGIVWHPLRYHKSPTAIATAYDITTAMLVATWLVLRHRLELVHARSYVPSVVALALKRLFGVAFIFDMRGFWADERVDGGIWDKNSALFRVAKWFERQFLLHADHVISLTRAAVEHMRRLTYLRTVPVRFTVIPTCADLTRFTPPSQTNRDRGSQCVIGYVGSVGTWYMFNEVVCCFRRFALKFPGTRFLIINRGEHEFIWKTLAEHNIPLANVEVVSCTHQEVPTHIRRMSAAVFFIKPALSKIASAPTRMAELLGCGVPCMSNTGIGDVEHTLHNSRTGVVVRGFDPETLDVGILQLMDLIMDPQVADRCATTARAQFSVEEGAREYARVYAEVRAR